MRDSKNTLTRRLTGFFSRTGGTAGLLYVLRFVKELLWEIVFLMALCVWLLWISADFLRSRKPRR